MNKRLRISLFSILAIILIFGGWTAFAATSSDAATSASVVGTFQSTSSDQTQVSISTTSGTQTISLAKSVWVYRNDQKAQLSDLKPGDQIELIMNSKQQAAYVKASSAEAPAASPAPSATPVPSPSAVPTATPSATPAAQAAPASPTLGTTAAAKDDTVYPGLAGIDLKIDGKHFKLQIKQVPGNGRTLYDLSIKPEGSGTVHLKGDEAAMWIKQLLAGVDLKSANAQQALLQELAEHYTLDTTQLNVQLKTNWKQSASDHNDDDKDDNGDKKENSQKADSPKPNPTKDEAKERAAHDDPHEKKDEHAKKPEKPENHKKNDNEKRGGNQDD
ncbi:hypothetical protein [Paenibacillus aestuarii]|uniref:DUF5666 domain-containing protein n=1 Tax=Paenibacillus aestuarii TaxID=516965 RepID=A0ABW0KDB2_9BACL|nr:hypothetical protein [Paenibacillus aestuarii]